MAMLAIALAALAASVLALPAVPLNARAAAPQVTIANGTVVGSSANGIDSFKGIPFAQPPTGPLRLKPPQPLDKPFGTFDATKTPASCPQMTSQTNNTGLPQEVIGLLADSPVFQAASGASEDCLTINVQRPSSASSDSELLPVVFWIFGGGFEAGSTSSYDGSNLISKSVGLGAPILYVAVNYRVGGFGFLAGKELQDDGSTNLGLRDQRLGLQWVAENIQAFGGDPDRVTIWGESAGSISVYDQLLINRGDNTYKGKPLFHGAVMDSGTAVPTFDVTSTAPQGIFNTVTANAGCSTSSDVLSCLRSLSYEKFLDTVNGVPGIFSYRSLDLSYLPRPDPHDDFFPQSPGIAGTSGAGLAQVPVIIGSRDQEDEGPLFSLVLFNVTTTEDLVGYLQTYFPSASQSDIEGLVDTYPPDPSAGSPFGTGLLNELYPGFKRNAAILGDLTFTLARRAVLSALDNVSPNIPKWSYLASYFYGTPFLGTFHGSDILEVYESAPFPEPASAIMTYYISFFNTLDPNALGTGALLIDWPQWTAADPSLLNFLAVSNQVIQDDFRQESYEYIVGHQSNLVV